MNLQATKRSYGFLWGKSEKIDDIHQAKWHFTSMQEVVREPIVRGSRGIDVGCGCGYDTYLMAKNNPGVEIVSVDLSDGVYKTKELAAELNNVQVVKCSVLATPLKANTFDFVYSFGVLHHTPNPHQGLLEIARILKAGSPAFLYLYEDHGENKIKYLAVKIVAQLRKLTVKIPPKILYLLSWICSPLVFILFSLPCIILRKFRAPGDIVGKIPFNFASNPFLLPSHLFDRFSAPVEYRFSREQVHSLFAECGFDRINIARLPDTAGWVAWGYKA